MQTQRGSGAALTEYVRVFRKRKWIILAAAMLVPAAAVLFSLHQDPLYAASAKVFISRDNLANTLTGTQDPSTLGDPARLIETQASLAQVAPVRRRALDAAGLHNRSVADFAKASDVTPKTDTDLIEFTVRDRDAVLATRLATDYARQFTIYRQQLDTRSLKRAEGDLEKTLASLRASGARRSAIFANLSDKLQQLRTLEALQTSNTFVVEKGASAVKVRPRPVRNGILGLGLGLLAGLGLAFLFEALDTRLRSAGEVTHELGLPLLARIPEPSRRYRRQRRLEVVDEPASPAAEAFRVLRTNLEFANLERGARSVMISSALEGEGKSTTVASLAVSLARAGKHVVLADLDLREPTIARFFDLEQRPGVVDVAVGKVELDRALVTIALADPELAEPGSSNGRGDAHGLLEVLPAGRTPPNPGEFIESRALERIIESLAERADLLLIDSPPLLSVNDALALSAKVDALVLVSGVHVLRRRTVAEVGRVLAACPAAKLGIVSTGTDAEEPYGYGDGYRYPAQPAAESPVRWRPLARRSRK